MARHAKNMTDSPKPARPGAGGKVANDHNKTGAQPPQQKNEGRRTPQSRHDREAQLGSDNQPRARQGGAGAPKGGKSR